MKNTRETLSALIDGEAEEIEIHRLLRVFRDDDSLRRSWALYQFVRGVARQGSLVMAPSHHEALHRRISETIEAEDPHERRLPARRRAYQLPAMAASFAVAASVTLAVFFGFNLIRQDEAAEPETTALVTAPVSQAGGPADSAETPELVELDKEKQHRLRNYLYQHDRMARMTNNARTVDYKTGNEG